jgi:undecaprenyl-diphosphatase
MAVNFRLVDTPPQLSAIRRNLVISGLAFGCALSMALLPDAFDRPATLIVNSFANHSWYLDYFVHSASTYFTFSGIILMALIWYCWFESPDTERRARVLVATLAAIAAGGVSRLLQHNLPTHPRPYYDPALNFQLPLNLEAPSNTWDSFPSDHVTVFAGLAIVLWATRSRFAAYAFVGMAIVESFRTYIGAHYPSDLIAGVALASFAVWLSQLSWPVSVGKKVLLLERSSPAAFYMGAFFVSYQIATLFVDFRHTLGPVRDHILSR